MLLLALPISPEMVRRLPAAHRIKVSFIFAGRKFKSYRSQARPTDHIGKNKRLEIFPLFVTGAFFFPAFLY